MAKVERQVERRSGEVALHRLWAARWSHLSPGTPVLSLERIKLGLESEGKQGWKERG